MELYPEKRNQCPHCKKEGYIPMCIDERIDSCFKQILHCKCNECGGKVDIYISRVCAVDPYPYP